MPHRTPAARSCIVAFCVILLLGATHAWSQTASTPTRQPIRTSPLRPPTSQPATSQPASSVGDLPLGDVLAASANIDSLVEANYRSNKLQPNPPARDEVFLRRTYLGLIGRIPTYQETRAFIDSRHPNKRSMLIDELLDSEGYLSHQFNYFADLLRVKSYLTRAPGIPYVNWIKQSLRDNKPYDRMVYELLTAEGYTWENGAAGYYQRDFAMPLDNMSNTTQTFLGTRLVCAQCHDHPTDIWTQLEYHQMAAFTYGIETQTPRGVNPNIDELHRLVNREAGTQDLMSDVRQAARQLVEPLAYRVTYHPKPLKLPHDYKYDDAKPHDVVAPATIFGPAVDEDQPPRDAYAAWLTSPENPRFTLVIANRLWKRVFGVGLIEPVDDLKAGNEPSNPELMQFLVEQMVHFNYDLKQFTRMLYNTKVYQRSVGAREPEAGVPYHFPGPVLRRMSAEQMWDSFLTLAIEDVDLRKGDDADRSYNYQKLEAYRRTDAQVLLAMARELGKEIYAARVHGRQQNDLRVQIEVARKANQMDRVAMLETQAAQLREEYTAYVRELRRAREDATEPAAGGMMTGAMQPTPTPPQQDPRWKAFGRDMVRASELPQPAPLGHFLRMWGQSDRDLIENASTDAGVPQILSLLNGPAYDQMMRVESVLVRHVNSTDSPRERIRIIFLTVLNRPPTEPEIALGLREVKQFGPEGYGNIVWALLNTRQFSFIQ